MCRERRGAAESLCSAGHVKGHDATAPAHARDWRDRYVGSLLTQEGVIIGAVIKFRNGRTIGFRRSPEEGPRSDGGAKGSRYGDSEKCRHNSCGRRSCPRRGLAGSSLYPFVLLSLRTMIYLGWAAALFGFPVSNANWVGALLVLVASVLAFSGLGILSASYLLVFKKGNPVNWAVIGVSSVVGGMMYPVSVLPKWLQFIARLTPVTYSLEGMRAALLGHASFLELWPSHAALLIFAVLLLPISFLVFSWALRRTKIAGTLTHF